METKHVTIWFQNKRQMDRKVALQNTTNHSNGRTSYQHPQQYLLPNSPCMPFAMQPTTSMAPRPSLDHIASRSELRYLAPHTPSRQHNPHAAVWENMPSSPLGPGTDTYESVREREEAYIEFSKRRVKLKGRKSLEWACASARVAGSGKENASLNGNVNMSAALDLDDLGEVEEGDETDEPEEVHEAVTPNSSFEHSLGAAGRTRGSKAMIQDEEMMAAYVLCGLGLGRR